MNRGIQAVATGMTNSEQWLDVTANNLANVSTTGFKRDGMTFQDAVEQQLSSNGGLGHPIGSIGQGPTVIQQFTTTSELGPISVTGNPLDVALKTPNAMFAVQRGNQTLYTRDGSFELDAERNLVTKQGYPVLDDRGSPIQLGPGSINISATGAVSVTDKGTTQQAGQLGAYTGTFTKYGENLFSAPNASAAENSQFVPNALEGSNVSAVASMIDLIKINRSYELQQKTITQQDQLTQKLVQSIG